MATRDDSSFVEALLKHGDEELKQKLTAFMITEEEVKNMQDLSTGFEACGDPHCKDCTQARSIEEDCESALRIIDLLAKTTMLKGAVGSAELMRELASEQPVLANLISAFNVEEN